MKLSYFCLLALVTVVTLEGKWTSAAPSQQTEDVLKTLLQLDRMYSAGARPRFGKRGKDDGNFLGFDYLQQEYRRPDHNLKLGNLPENKYVLDVDPLYR